MPKGHGYHGDDVNSGAVQTQVSHFLFLLKIYAQTLYHAFYRPLFPTLTSLTLNCLIFATTHTHRCILCVLATIHLGLGHLPQTRKPVAKGTGLAKGRGAVSRTRTRHTRSREPVRVYKPLSNTSSTGFSHHK